MDNQHRKFAGWVYSQGEEQYSSGFYETKELAIEAAKEDFGDHDFIVAKAFKPDGIEFFPDAGDLIERAQDNLAESDAGGEWSEDWLETSKQARKRVSDQDIARLDFALKEAFGKWMDETGNRPDFYTVGESEEIEIKQEPA